MMPTFPRTVLFVASLLPWIPVGNAAQQFSSAGDAAAAVAAGIRSLLDGEDGSRSWGDRGDLMGLLVRLPFHDAATYNVTDGGSDGCVDLDSSENNGLKEAIDLLEPIRLGATYLGGEDGSEEQATLSRGDTWALAGNVMIEAGGGPRLEFKLGRADAEDCVGQGSRHVDSESTSSEKITEAFVDRLGFTPREVVALIGAHVLGKAAVNNSGYEGKWVEDNDVFTNQYFIDLLHVPWIKEKETVEPFGKRTTWKRFDDNKMGFREEIMLQTDVDLAFQTTGGYFCSRVGGSFSPATSCPNATHSFSSHVRDFALDQGAWFDEFGTAWAKLTSLTNEELACAVSDCKTPTNDPTPTETSMAASITRNGMVAAVTCVVFGILLGWT